MSVKGHEGLSDLGSAGAMMIKQEMKGLLAIWADIDEDYRMEFEKWHNCEHMADRVTIPGFYVGYRYEGIGDAPYSLMIYETSDSAVLESKAYLHSKNNPTPWAREALSHYKNTVRMIYSLLATAGKKPSTQAPYIFVVRFNSEPGGEKEAIRWWKEEFLSKIIALPGVYRGRLYEVNAEISNIITEEQKIYGRMKIERQRFLALIEIASLNLPEGKGWQDAYMETSDSSKSLRRMKNVSEELYWLRFVMYAPESNYTFDGVKPRFLSRS